MADISNQVRSLIETFIADIAALVRQDTLRQISEALGSVGTIAVKRGPGRPRKTEKPVAKKVVLKKGEKRTSDALQDTALSVLNIITSNPGQGVEQISKGLGVSSGELKLPIKKLLAEGLVKTKGQRRGTKYFAK